MKKLLITGSSGQVGSALYDHTQKDFDVIGVAKEASPEVSIVLDISDADAWRRYLDHAQPDIIVHTAALTWVDFSEDHHEETDAANVRPIEVIAAYARAQKTVPQVIFISSDYVYDGKKTEGAYTEHDPVNPLNYYGVSKVRGEEIVRTIPGSCILRPGVVFSWHPEGKNFFMQVWKTLSEKKDMKVVDDQISNPTYTPSLVRAILTCAKKGIHGTFNATGPDTVDRYTFAKQIAEFFDLDAAKIIRAKTSDFASKAERPMYDATDSTKLYSALGWKFDSLSAAFRDIQEQLRSTS